MVPLSDAIYLSISPIPGDDLRSNCPRPVPGNKISELRVYGFIRFNSTRSRWISIDQIVLFSTFALTNWGRRYFQENTGSLKISSLNRNDTPVYIYRNPVIQGCLSPHRYRLNWILSSRDIVPGRYVPILHQRPPEQEPRERPPCSVRNNRVTSTCPEFHGDHLFEHAYTRCIPPVCSSSPTLNIKKESRVLRDFKYIKKESTLFHLLDILLIPLSIILKNIYIYIRIQFYFPSSSKISPDEDNPLSRYRHVNISWRTGRFCETTLYRRANGLTKGPVKR